MDCLTSLPSVVLVVGWLAITVSIAVRRPGSASCHSCRPTEHDRVQHIAAPLMPALGATFGVLMALTLASEAGYLKAAQDKSAREAAAASRLAWASTSPGVDTDAIQDCAGRVPRGHPRRASGTVTPRPGGDPGVAVALASLERVVRARSCTQRARIAGQHRTARLARRPHDEPPGTHCRRFTPTAAALRDHARRQWGRVDRERGRAWLAHQPSDLAAGARTGHRRRLEHRALVCAQRTLAGRPARERRTD